ncbi:MAG: RNA polymerase sigma factor [Anaerovorax sp.]
MKEKREFINEIYDQKFQIIRGYLMKKGCGIQDAEDIVQETFIKAIEYTLVLTEENVSSWLFKVALNKYYDLCRREKKYPRLIVDEEIFADLFVQEDGMKKLLQKDEGISIQKVLDSLSETSKNLLLLKYDMGLTYDKIGQILDINGNNLKTYFYRARNEFKKKWEEEMNGK